MRIVSQPYISPVSDELAADVAHPYYPLEITHDCSEEASRDLVGPALQLELFARGTRVEGFLFAEFGQQRQTGEDPLIKPAHDLGQIVALLVLDHPILHFLQLAQGQGEQAIDLPIFFGVVVELHNTGSTC
jgi:hypothetical protein